MKDNQNEHNMGEQIMDALSDALQSGNFNDLNRLVSQSVTTALNEVGKHIQLSVNEETQDWTSRFSPYADSGQAARSQEDSLQRQAQERARQQEQAYRQQAQQQPGQQGQAKQQSQDQTWQQAPEPSQQRAQERARRQEQAKRREQEQLQRQEQARQRAQELARRQEQARQQAQGQKWNQNSGQQYPSAPRQKNITAFPPCEFKKVGNVSNVLYQVFGGIGLGLTSLTTFFHFTLLVSNETTSLAGWIANMLFLGLFAGMIRLGIGQRRRLKLAERYAGLCGHKLYGDIEQLAKSTGRKTRRVIKDLQKMMKLGMFPEGHLDDQKTCFMLSDGIYRQYLETENNRRLLEEENRKITAHEEERTVSENKTNPGQAPNLSEQESELNAMVAEGMECIRKLRLLNDKIPGEVISAKLFRLESLLKNLFDSVREHPEQMHRMHKLMNYYLPTTLKLVEAYEEFDRVSVPGDDIIAAKSEIENTLDTINQAFTELLNNLFQDAVLDATTDAQVLKTMLAREGLMNEMDFTAARSDSGF